MDLRRLAAFLAVLDEGGFTRGASALHISQPALSQAVRALEAELGTALFDRVGRRVHLTAAGHALVEPARQALRDVETGRAAVEAVRGLTAGRLELGSLRTLAADPTAALIGAFRAAYPGITVFLADPDDPDDLFERVRDGRVELAVTERPRRSPGLVVRALGSQALVVILPPDGPRTRGPLRLAELAERPLVVTPPGTSNRRLLDDAFARAGLTPRVAVETAQREAVLPLVLAGAGAALVPRPTADTAVRLGARRVLTDPVITRDVVLLHRHGPRSPAAERFLTMALGERPRATRASRGPTAAR